MDELGKKKQNNKNQLKNKNNKSLKTKIEKRTYHFSKKKIVLIYLSFTDRASRTIGTIKRASTL